MSLDEISHRALVWQAIIYLVLLVMVTGMLIVQVFVLQPRAERDAFVTATLAIAQYLQCQRVALRSMPELTREGLQRLYIARAQIVPGLTCDTLTKLLQEN